MSALTCREKTIGVSEMKFVSLVLAILAVGSSHADGDASERREIYNFAAALVPSAQMPPADKDIALMRASLICGRHRNVYGLDFGVVGNITDEEMLGCGIAFIFNRSGNSRSAFQFAGGLNRSDRDFKGLQMALVVNDVERNFIGLQIGLADIADALAGMQFGGFNKVRSGTGLQLGAVNVAEQFTGVQIGVLNLNLDSPVPLAPIFNCYF